MRLREFSEDPGVINLITVLNHLINRNDEEGGSSTINTGSLINMVSNTGSMFSYDALVAAYETNPAVKNLISNFSKDEVTLSGEDETDISVHSDGEESGDAVSGMASRAVDI